MRFWRRNSHESPAFLRAFDADWYMSQYPDVALSGLKPERHFLRYGHIMGRDPGPNFSTSFARAILHLGPEDEPIAAMARLEAQKVKADRRQVLQAAGEVALQGRDDLAIALADRWLTDKLQPTAHLLRANAALHQQDEAGWLAELNAYLSTQGVAEIALRGDGPLITRLQAAQPVEPIPAGPLVSVLMAAWNGAETIEMAVCSILDQSWRQLELIVVDDCSSDETWAVLTRLASKDSRLKILRNEINAGPYVSRNIALSQANGQWITGHDADDWAHPERIARQVQWCIANDAPACLSGMLRVAPDGELVRFNPIGGNVVDGACRNAFISLMVDAQVLHGALGYWDEVRVAGDSEMIHRLQMITGRDIHTIDKVTMLCLDNPAGLTNHSQLGHSESGGISPHRRAYKKSFMKFHSKIKPHSARLEFPAPERRFSAASEMLNAAQTVTALVQSYAARGLRLKRDLEADVAIVTNLAFRGGNTSSTMEEVEYFRRQGLKVALIHCPTLRDVGRRISPKFDGVGELVTSWTRLASLRAKVLIIRHPVVVTSPSFREIAPHLSADHTYVVKNNSRALADGRDVYDMADMIATVRQINTPELTFCPISGAMRDELLASGDSSIRLSENDWLPTLDESQYFAPPKDQMSAPYRIGRHGRDGVEKWRQSADELRAIFPDDPEFRVSILGGARNGLKILGARPANWTVHKFGDIPPLDYLQSLDVFAYFPHSGLVEGFGRAIAEAMLAGVPCILPASFQSTFGDLALYATPREVADLVRRIARDDEGRVAYLSEVQQIVRQQHAPDQIGHRLAAVAGISSSEGGPAPVPELSAHARAWRQSVLTP